MRVEEECQWDLILRSRRDCTPSPGASHVDGRSRLPPMGGEIRRNDMTWRPPQLVPSGDSGGGKTLGLWGKTGLKRQTERCLQSGREEGAQL